MIITSQIPSTTSLFPMSDKENSKNFGEILKDFLITTKNNAYGAENKLHNYVKGNETIEEIAPMIAELSLNFEAVSKITEVALSIPKTLFNMQI
ncbi:MAG: hypothetical protein ACTSXG_01515 [Alphaproteobacteria bacterium]